MAIPDPTTPGDATTCPGQHGGPTLSTTDFKPFSLSGGDGKNEILFSKSRSGAIIALDDHDSTVRFQDKTGKAEIWLKADEIEIKQKTGDITCISEKETRFDCKNFEVHASNNISFSAGTDICSNVSSAMKIDAGQSISFSADKNVDFVSHQKIDGKAMAEMNVTGKKKTSVCTKSGSMTTMSVGKTALISKKDMGILSKAMLSATGVSGASFKSSQKITIKAGGMVIGMAMCININ